MNPFSVVFASRYLAEEDPTFRRQCNREADDHFLAFCLDNHSPPAIPFHYVNVFFTITKKESSGKWIVETNTYETHYLSLAYFGPEAVSFLFQGFTGTTDHSLFLPIQFQVSRHLEYMIDVIAITYHGKGCPHTPEQKLDFPHPVYYDTCENKTNTKSETDHMLWC